MADLFAFGSGAGNLDADSRYGNAGDLKKTQYVMQLLGFPGDADTLKALVIAGEKGIEVESGILDVTRGANNSEDYHEISPMGIMPALKEAHYKVAGDLAIISFIEGRGLGNRMTPRNAEVLAHQNYWIDIARDNVAPYVQTIMAQRVLNAMSDPGTEEDSVAVEAAKMALVVPLDALDAQLATKEYIVGEYSYADVHWTSYIHLLCVAGEQNLVQQRANMSQWWERIKSRKSFSGQNLVAYDLLPSLDDIKAKRMQDVVIDDF
ncbi:MAG: glutathione S-transferase family protein [Candidatus Thiodiazotropha sp.]